MKIKINGEVREVEAGASVGALLDRLGIERRNLAVEYNGDFLEEAELDAKDVREGDILEIVRFVGGG